MNSVHSAVSIFRGITEFSMLREYLFAKIHRCVVTGCHPNYMGSITIDPELLDCTGIQVN